MKKWIAIFSIIMMSLSLALAEGLPFEEFLPESTLEPTTTIAPEETLQPEETQEPPIMATPEETQQPEETFLPEETENPLIGNGMIAYLYDYIIPFAFDPNYSGMSDGIVQADFYYESDEVIYDLFLLVPPSVETGDILTPGSSPMWNTEDVGVIFRIVTVNGERYAYATVYDAYAYPYGSDFQIAFESVEREGDAMRVQGYFTAVLAPEYLLTASENLIEISGSFAFEVNIEEELNSGYLLDPDGGRAVRYAM